MHRDNRDEVRIGNAWGQGIFSASQPCLWCLEISSLGGLIREGCELSGTETDSVAGLGWLHVRDL